MPRLSLWKPTKTNDYYFLDNTIKEQFEIGGTGAYVHKYIGPQSLGETGDPAQPNYRAGEEVDPITGDFTNLEGVINETKIQDLLFMENRDRKYDPCIYELRGVYNVSDNDFDLTQFGLFLTNDVLFMTFHMNHMVEIIGRRLMPGDVIELPHLLDDLALDATKCDPIPKFYVVQDANRGSEGFSATWMPHIWRVKLSPITDSQEYADILGNAEQEDSLKNVISSYKKELDISNAIVEAAEKADPIGESLTEHLFGFDNTREIWEYGETINSGTSFPSNPNEGDYFVRTDFQPKRLFVRRGSKWQRLYDNVTAQTWSEKTYNAEPFINNDATTVVADKEFSERQAISKAILPRADAGGTTDPLDGQINTGTGTDTGTDTGTTPDPELLYVDTDYVADDYVEDAPSPINENELYVATDFVADDYVENSPEPINNSYIVTDYVASGYVED